MMGRGTARNMWRFIFRVGFALSQATKVLRESRGIALLYFRRGSFLTKLNLGI